MTSQERITELANAALRAAPPTGRVPKPATYMPSFEKMRGEEFIEKPLAGIAPVPATRAAAPSAVPEPAPAPVVEPVESDKELAAMLDQRDETKFKKQKRASIATTGAILAILSVGGAYAAFSPTAQRKVKSLVTVVRQSGEDVKSLGSIMGTYEEQLDKVAVQSSRIEAATVALGVDPNENSPTQDDQISAAMKEMSGGDTAGPTAVERDAALQATFRIVAKLGEDIAPEPEKARADVSF